MGSQGHERSGVGGRGKKARPSLEQQALKFLRSVEGRPWTLVSGHGSRKLGP